MTIKDIAKIAGVSEMTVTRAFVKGSSIKPETRERILQIAAKYDYRPSKTAGRLSSQNISIGIALLDASAELTRALLGSADKAYEELKDFKVSFETEVFGARDGLCGALETLRDKNVNAATIFTDICDKKSAKLIKECRAGGMKIVQGVNELQNAQRDYLVHSRNDMTGRIAAQILCDITPKDGEFAAFIGSSDVLLHKQVLSAFSSGIREQGRKTPRVYDIREDGELEAKYARELLDACPELSGVYITTANAAPFVNVLKERGLSGKVRVIATDPTGDTVGFLEDGSIKAFVSQTPYRQMYEALRVCFELASGAESGGELNITPQIIIKSNIEAYKGEWLL